MRILMMTNTYAPVVGGIEESVHSFSQELRRQGHKVVIVTPEFAGMKHETDVIRIPAIKNVLRPNFSVSLTIPLFLTHFVKEFQPDIIHSHQFFLVGNMALRLARLYHIPLVYTHHILLEKYVDLLPIHNKRISRFVIKLATGYANLSSAVIVPSMAVYDLLERSGVTQPMNVIPTGIDVERFANGDGGAFRQSRGIPQDAFVAGCVCRLMPEKNLGFLAVSASRFLTENKKAHCMIVGDGSYKEEMRTIFSKKGVAGRVHFTGVLHGQELTDAYHAMDVFMFSSHSETQGLVLLEAMACRTPVVVVNAPAYKSLIDDHRNGRVVAHDDTNEFAEALSWFAHLDVRSLQKIKNKAHARACNYSIQRCTQRLLEVYRGLADYSLHEDRPLWSSLKDCLKVEKDLLQNAVLATEAAFKRKSKQRKSYV